MISIDRPENNSQEKGKWHHVVFADDLKVYNKTYLDSLFYHYIKGDNILIVGNEVNNIISLINYFYDKGIL